ncbi:hypothetical protein OG413_36970 [Streptomyces sp. NBC_01433]|nr:hypothetical protein [Streptomyces sp. NBC_01433]MCX4680807.1 hypothetical protein [Streptomyces sp. NBC_01433]
MSSSYETTVGARPGGSHPDFAVDDVPAFTSYATGLGALIEAR